MKVSVVQGGGFAGLVTTTVADTASLAPGDARELKERVEEADIFGLTPAGSDAQPDAQTYEISVDDNGRHCQLVVTDDSLTPAVRALISFIGSVPGHEERIGPPGR